MLKGITLLINEYITLIIEGIKADELFIKSIIKFFDKNDIISKISNQDDNRAEINEFLKSFTCGFELESITEEEMKKLYMIFALIFYSVKDDLIVEIKT